MTNTFVLAVYEIDRAYGGPEEGGWWFDTGQLIRVIGTRKSEHKARELARRLNGWLNRLQAGHRDVSSVLYSGGRYHIIVHRNQAPDHFPEARPHYE